MHRPLAIIMATAVACGACATNKASPILDTTTAKSTTAPTSSVPSSIATTTSTTSVTTTTTTAADLRAAVISGFDAGEKAYLAALADPAHFDPATIQATYAPGTVRDNVIASLQDFARQGLRTRPGPRNLQYYVVEAMTPGPPPVATASVNVCSVSDSIVYIPHDPSDPSQDQIVNAEFVSRRRTWTMVLDAGVWKRQSITETDKKVGENTCPANAS